MKTIRVDEVEALRSHAERVYELGRQAPTEAFDSAVEHLIRGLDEVCNTLEEHGRRAAQDRKTVAVKGLHDALRKMDAATSAIDVARRHHSWEYHGTQGTEREQIQDDVSVVGLWTLKSRFNDLLTLIRHERVRSIVRKALAERFAEEFVFEPILVVPTVDDFGDGDGSTYLRILVVFDGDQERLDPAWTSGLIRRIEPRLIEAGVEEFPSVSFIKKSEWWQSFPQWQRRHPGAIQMVEFPPETALPSAGRGR